MYRSTLLVTITIFISRITGYIRDAVMAAFIGTGPLNDAFIAAFKLTNLFRSLFAEGALSASFVPILSRVISSHGKKYATVIACHIFSILLIALSVFTILILYNMSKIISITNPGFSTNNEILELAIDLACITFPYLILISIAAFYGAVMQSHGFFIPYAATSIILNVVLISCPLMQKLLSHNFSTAAHPLAYGVVVSGVLEVLWMIYFAWKYDIKIHIRKPIITKHVRNLSQRIIPSLIGSGVTQISVWCDMVILSFFTGGMSYLYFADRIIQLPLALFSTASSITLLPFLSKKHSDSTIKTRAFNKTIRIVLSLTIASTIGIFLITREIITVLFKRGAFDEVSVQGTCITLKMLCVGLPAYAMIKIYVAVFHAHGETSTPVKIASISLIVNLICSVIFIQFFNHAGVALAASVAAWCNLILLVSKWKKSAQKLHGADIFIEQNTYIDIVKYFCAGTVIWVIISILKEVLANCNLHIVTVCTIYIVTSAIAYCLTLVFIRAKIIKDIFR